ncbi:MAG: VanZ family protein [Thermodesulfobacteriota bacterium]
MRNLNRTSENPMLKQGYVAAVLYMALIFILSVRKSPEAVELFWQADKAAHFILYALMGFLWARALVRGSRYTGVRGSGKKVIAAAFTISFLYGVFIEFVQHFIPERSGEVMDALVNGMGGFFGAFMYGYFFSRK